MLNMILKGLECALLASLGVAILYLVFRWATGAHLDGLLPATLAAVVVGFGLGGLR